MTDFPHDHALPHLSVPEARLSGVLARPRRIAFGCVIALTMLGWAALAMMAARTTLWQALCGPWLAGAWSDVAVAVPMWVAMTLAMMLPTAGPMVLTYAEIADTAARKHERAVSPLILVVGYVLVWLGFACAAAGLQFALAHAGVIDGGHVGRLVGGAIFAGVGLYQFSALKRACLTVCQRPFPFFFANWTTERAGVLRLGLRQGLVCVGCCWAMMLLMFAVGTMNVVWMAVLGVLMTIEKLTSTPRFSEAMGIALVGIGFGMVAASVAG